MRRGVEIISVHIRVGYKHDKTGQKIHKIEVSGDDSKQIYPFKVLALRQLIQSGFLLRQQSPLQRNSFDWLKPLQMQHLSHRLGIGAMFKRDSFAERETSFNGMNDSTNSTARRFI